MLLAVILVIFVTGLAGMAVLTAPAAAFRRRRLLRPYRAEFERLAGAEPPARSPGGLPGLRRAR